MGSINAILETHAKHRRSEQLYKIEHFNPERIYVPLNLSSFIAYNKVLSSGLYEQCKFFIK